MSEFERLLTFLKVDAPSNLSQLIKTATVTFNQKLDQWGVFLTVTDFLPANLICDLELAAKQHSVLQLQVQVKSLPLAQLKVTRLREYLQIFLSRLYPGGKGMCVDWGLIKLTTKQHVCTAVVPVQLDVNYRLLLQYQAQLQTHLEQYGWPAVQLRFEQPTGQQRVASPPPVAVASRVAAASSVTKSGIHTTPQSSTGRVELHVHTKMTVMDGVGAVEDYFKRARQLHCSALAFTDRANVQAFPLIERISQRYPEVKPIYGIQFNVFEDVVRACWNASHTPLRAAKYAFLDLETTGLSSRFDEIIEFGLVLVDNITDINLSQASRVSIQVRPTRPISAQAQALSKIKMTDLKTAPPLAQALPQIIKHLHDRVVVAHNADFDWSFMRASCERLQLATPSNPVLDTLTLARILLPQVSRFRLETVVRHFKIKYETERAHRALYDAELTCQIFKKLLSLLEQQHQVVHLDDINRLEPQSLFLKQKPFWMTVLCRNQAGLKTLFKLVSMSHTESFFHQPQISRQVLMRHRANLLIGSSGVNNEVLMTACTKSDPAVAQLMAFYDYIEIPPPSVLQPLTTQFNFSQTRIAEILTNIIRIARQQGKRVVMTSDAHYAAPTDWIIRDIYVKTEGLRGRRHYLYNSSTPHLTSPPQHLRSTTELLAEVKFLDSAVAQEIIITNPRLLADQIKRIQILKTELFPPVVASALNELESLCWQAAKNKYGTSLPALVKDRLARELKIIFQHQFAVIFWIAEKVVKASLKAGYLVGSRGSVGSSLVAMLMGVTEVNPLPVHYLCHNRNCCFSDFNPESKFKSGFDLPVRNCPRCQQPLVGDGHNIPFSTFLGLRGEKVPDIDLNFAGEYQEQAHEQVRQMFGTQHTFRAGTISTVANRTAFIYVTNYFKRYGKKPTSRLEFEALVAKCTGIKRTTGQHPGGIVIIPSAYEVEDFTPVNYPANDLHSKWLTTHFDFEALHNNLLKIDILGHDDPRVLRMLFDLTKQDPLKITFQDAEVMSLFTSTRVLKIADRDYRSHNGALGIPEFGTGFVRRMLTEIKPRRFADLVAISGLSHGKKVWVGNFRDLFLARKLDIDEVFACRDDIFIQLRQRGIDERAAFRIMEQVRNGQGITRRDQKLMLDLKVEQWLITACEKISYLFPKAHAVAYVMMAWRVAWYKINFPVEYYAAFFSVRIDNFDLPVILGGKQIIREAQNQLKTPAQTKASLLDKKKQVLYEVALEMYARNIQLINVDLNQSAATDFKVVKIAGRKVILPPLSAVANLGSTVANSIIAARQHQPITSVTDLQARTKVSRSHLHTLRALKVLTAEHENQMQLGLFS